MKNYAWQAVKRMLRKGEVRTVHVLQSLAIEVEKLADIQQEIAEADGPLNCPRVREVASETALILRQVAGNIRLHSVSHVGEPPVKLSAKEVAMVLAPPKEGK